MSKRILSILLCLVMVFGMLAGCTPKKSQEPTTQTTAGETKPQTGDEEKPKEEEPSEQPSGGQSGTEGGTEETPGGSQTGNEEGTEEKPGGEQTGDQPSAGLPSYMVRFFTNGGETIESRYYLQGTSISKLPTPYRLSHRFEGWFYDAALTKPAAGTDKVNGPVSLYAKYSALEAPEEVKLASFASSLEEKSSFTLEILCDDESLTAEEVQILLSVKNLSAPEEKDFYTVTGEKGCFVLSGKDGFRPGSTFRVKLEDGRLTFKDHGASIREYNFTTAKEAVMNVQLSDGLVYIPMEQLSDIVNNGQQVDTLSLPVYTMDSEGNMTPAAMTSGQFTYTGAALQVDDTVVVYNGLRPDLRNENSTTEENGEVAYLKITAVNGTVYSYTSAKAEEILLRPDLLPVQVELDLDSSEGTVTLKNEYLDYSDDIYANIRLDSETTVDVGDFLMFHEGSFSLQGADPVGYGRITVVTVGPENTVITYEVCDWQTVESSMDLRTTESISGEKMLEGVNVEELEQQIEDQARASGFADEMALYLVSMATATENFTELPDGMELSDIKVILDDGSEMSADQLRLMGEGITAKPSISRLKVWITNDLKHFDRTGVRVSLELGVKISFYKSFDNKVEGSEAPDKQIVLEVVGIFEQEVSLDLDVSAYAIWNNWGPYYYIDDFRMVAAIDMYTYSGVNVELNVGTKEKTQNGEYTGIEEYDKFVDEIIKAYKLKQALESDNTVDLTDQLADKYTEFLNNETDWVYLVDQEMFGFNIPIPAVFPILVLEMNCNFVISVDASVAMGLDYYTQSANRYVYTVDVLSLRVYSDVVPIQEEKSELTLYAFGRAGLRIGVKATFLIGLLDTEFISAGVSAEAGAYLKVFGYLYYCKTDSASQGVEKEFSGAMYLEVGGYLQINFESLAFVDLMTWSPTLYEDEWPIWTVGSRQNVLDFATEQEDMPEVSLKSNIQSAWLSDDLFVMEYLDLKEGGVHTAIYSDEDHFTVTMSNDKFAYDPATNTVTVNPDEDDVQLDGTMTITWDLDPKVFSSDSLERTISLHWDNLRDGYVIVPYTNGGSYVAILDQPYGTAVKAPKDPVKVGYVFTGWYTDPECTKSYTFPQTMPNEDANIYAGWEPATDTAYAVEHYTQVLGSSTYELAHRESFTGTTDSVVSPATRTYTGFITPARQEITVLPDGSGVVHYFYDRIVSTVTFDPGIVAGEKVSFLLQYGASVHAPKMAAEGYDFVGWDKDVASVMGAENITYTAQWKRSQVDYRVEFFVQQPDGRYTLQDKVSGQAVAGTELTESQLLALQLSGGKSARDTYTVPGGVEFASVTVGGLDLTAQGKPATVEAGAVIKVNFRRLTHTATFDPCNGQAPVTMTLYYGAALQAPAGLVRTGYAFAGWDKTVPATMGTKDLSFRALWTANDYKVVFHANGGTGTMAHQGMVYDREASLQKNAFARAGYDFAGWSLTPDSAPVFADGETVKNLTAQTSAVDLYAAWELHVYTIRYELGGGTNGANPTTYTVLDSFALAPATRTGYVFDGWKTDSGSTLTGIEAGSTGDLVLTAQWKPATDTAYTVEHWLEGLNGGEAQLARTDKLSGTTDAKVTPAVTSFEGFTAPKTQTVTVKADGSLVVKYVYSRNSYTLTFVYRDNKTQNSVITAQYGAAVSLPNPTREGYGFGGWYRNEDATGERWTTTVMGAESLTLYAKWIAGEYGYTVIHRTENLDGTWTVVETEHNTGKMDQKLTPAVRSIEGFTAPETITLTIGTGDNTVTYDYTRNSYTLTWLPNGGTNSGSFTQGKVLYGAPITEPAVSRTGYTFQAWSEEVPQVMPARDVTLTAQWKINSYSLKLYTVSGQLWKELTLDYGAKLPALGQPARDGYRFTGWDQTLPDTMPAGDVTACAQWSILTYSISYVGVDGAVNPNPSTYTVETRGFRLAEPGRTGYTFLGWQDETGNAVTEVSSASLGDRSFTALWSANRYSVYYHACDGTGRVYVAEDKVYDTAFAADSNTFTRPGYAFAGWALTEGGQVTYADGATLKNLTAEAGGVVHLYAVWTAESYGIEYNLDGLANDPRNPETYVMDSEITLYAPVGAPTGKHFAGWYLDAKLTKPAGETLWVSVAGGLALYPKWEANSYVINYFAFRKDTNRGDAQQVVTYGEPDWLLTVDQLNANSANRFENPGYTLTGWSLQENTAANVGVDAMAMQVMSLLGDRLPADHMSAINLHAVWTPNHYGVTFVGCEGVSSTPEGFLFTVESEEILLESYVPYLYTGYRFVGWYTDRSCTGDPVTSIPKGTHEDVILYAKCELIVYTIEYHGNGGGLVGDYTTTYTVKDEILIPEARYDTYADYQHFLGWYEDEPLHHPFYNDLNSNPRNVTLYAGWDLCTVYVGMDATPFALSGRVIVDWSKEENCDFNTHTSRPGMQAGRAYNVDIVDAYEVIFIGSPGKTYTNFMMHLCTYGGGDGLTLRFVDFNAVSNGTLINLYNTSAMYELEINVKGDCSLSTSVAGQNTIYVPGVPLTLTGDGSLIVKAGDGADATTAGGAGSNGGVGITANSIRDKLTGYVFVYGGNGGNGKKADDNNSYEGWADGQTGYTGGAGGDGGYAIRLLNDSAQDLKYSHHLYAFGGVGGNGGQGGRGGYSGVIGGTGGTGGTGGKGGNGAYGILATSNAGGSAGGYGGMGGKGGAGGEGGVGDKMWAGTVTKGATGSAGASGTTQISEMPYYQGNIYETAVTNFRSMSIYNNLGNGNVVHEKVGLSTRITVKGAASPGHGGFYQLTQSAAGELYIHVFVAKVPEGATLEFAANPYGDGGSMAWMGSNKGTGQYRPYAYVIQCGRTGTFSTVGFVYLNAPDAKVPLEWYWNYGTVYKVG